MSVSTVEVWAADIPDKPGALAGVLDRFAQQGASLDAVLARRSPDNPGHGVVFITPVKGKRAEQAARDAGFRPAMSITGLRIEGPDRPGLGGRIARAIGDAGVNMRGLNASVLGNRFVAYLSFDTPVDATRAAQAIRGMTAGRRTATATTGRRLTTRRRRATRSARA